MTPEQAHHLLLASNLRVVELARENSDLRQELEESKKALAAKTEEAECACDIAKAQYREQKQKLKLRLDRRLECAQLALEKTLRDTAALLRETQANV